MKKPNAGSRGVIMNRKYKGSTYIDSYIINGFDIFKEKWVNTGKSVKVKALFMEQ